MKNYENNSYFEKIRNHYIPLLKKYNDSYKAVDWGSSTGQNLRFKVLLEIDDRKNLSILDVGCGVGHLAAYLNSNQFNGSYTGIDALPEMIDKATQLHPEFDFKISDAIQNSYSSDVVIGSGLFTFSNKKHMRQVICSMYGACKVAVAFNSLSEWADNMDANEYHADPLDVIRFCRTLTPRVVLRHDYHPGDFTVYLYKNNK